MSSCVYGYVAIIGFSRLAVLVRSQLERSINPFKEIKWTRPQGSLIRAIRNWTRGLPSGVALKLRVFEADHPVGYKLAPN